MKATVGTGEDLRRDYRRFLGLLAGLGGGVRIRRQGRRAEVTRAGECLCRCLPESDSVHIFLGPDARKALRCASHEDFVDILQSILRRLRAAV